jgi:hypothetical protein
VKFLGCVAGLLSVLAPAAARAQENLDIDCPALSPDTQAELRARVRAEIGFRQAATYVSVACGEERAIVALIDDGEVRRAELPLLDPKDARALKERLLDRVAELVAPAAADEPASTQPKAVPSPRTTAPLPSYDQPLQPEPGSDSSTSALVKLGLRAESWGGAAVGDMGPRLLVGLGTGSVELGAGVAGAWALESPQGLHARSVSTFLLADGWVSDSIAIGAGAGLWWVTVSSPATTEVESTRLLFVIARARAKLVFAELEACVGPEVRIADQKVTARKAEAEVFTIPALTLGVGVELTMLRAKL